MELMSPPPLYASQDFGLKAFLTCFVIMTSINWKYESNLFINFMLKENMCKKNSKARRALVCINVYTFSWRINLMSKS